MKQRQHYTQTFSEKKGKNSSQNLIGKKKKKGNGKIEITLNLDYQMGVVRAQQRLNTESTKKKQNKNVWIKNLDQQFGQNFHQMINI